MNWSNVRLILAREIRDQLRDRRTLFMIAVLPILLYPLMGMSFLQVVQFTKEQTTNVLVVGASKLSVDPPLIVDNHFSPALFSKPDDMLLYRLEFAPSEPAAPGQPFPDPREDARQRVLSGQYDAAVFFPPGFAEKLRQFRAADAKRAPAALDVPKPEIIHTTANERSDMAEKRLRGVLDRWTEALGQANLVAVGVSPSVAKPFDLATADLAEQTGTRGIATWARILPVMLLLWALTGAFYPAVDLCAGEKERGTLETLLSSPAERSEIVVGKLATIMIFSMATVVLNIASLGATGWLVLARIPNMNAGTPPLMSLVWLVVALVPISALFSALCLALAAFAKSTKEGQYYLMPLLLITMPLAVLPMAPGVELTFGNSLIPVTNVVLLLRSMMEGNYHDAIRFALPVIVVTAVCCLLSLRWAVDQFNQESVLFRESERLDLGLWFRHLVRDRQPTPSVGAALFFGAMVLVIKFFVELSVSLPDDPQAIVDAIPRMAALTQFGVILTPALLMTFLFSRQPAKTLLLDRASWRHVPLAVPAAILLAVVFHPVAMALNGLINALYPVQTDLSMLDGFVKESPLWLLVLVIAVLPAVCEETAFRGFMLSGLRHLGRKWWAIVLSAVFFGLSHGILQQSISASILGAIIGFVAVQSGSLLPCIAFHATHNALAMVIVGRLTPENIAEHPILQALVRTNPEGEFVHYGWFLVSLGAILSAMLLTWFAWLRYEKTDEEKLRDAIQRGTDAEDERLAGGLDDALSEAASRAFR